MKGIIWYNNRNRGEEKINEIVNHYNFMGIRIIKKLNSKNNSFVIFENGDIWSLVDATESARGQRCNISFIEQSIKKDFINIIIKPCTTALPFTAYNYY